MTEPRHPDDQQAARADQPDQAPRSDAFPDPLLQVDDLRVTFPVRSGVLQRVTGQVRAVDGVSFAIPRGTTLGLVGESGSGKTTVGRAVLRLIEPTSGKVLFDGKPVRQRFTGTPKSFRRDMQIVFQDPAGALNPRMRVGDIIAEPIHVHGIARGHAVGDRVRDVLERCGMPANAADRYPHEFSGGQRQRLVIARALASNPRFLVCDEPTSALDVSIQSQIINLLRDLQRDLGLTYLFISHDMAVIRHMCDQIAVMYRGRIVEQGERDQVLSAPVDDYTRRLLSAVPKPVPMSA